MSKTSGSQFPISIIRFPIFTGREMEGVFNRTMTLRSNLDLEQNHKTLETDSNDLDLT